MPTYVVRLSPLPLGLRKELITMRHTKSYMLPKLVCLNVLALMMFTFEHNTTANDQPLLKTARIKQPVPDAASQEVLIQTSVSQPAVEPQQAVAVERPVEVKKTAVYKKRMHRSARLNTPSMLIKAKYTSNTPVDCCFRGNRT